ncbi:MAG: hypothetical protein JWL59_1739 [Chthoniobacteraceae bacterium]|nr:hypothetical protein [Chthoniobacteraceae bacterium]
MVLPGATLFPKTLMPLRIFEPRYRQMLSFCLEHHRMFCIALMKPGVEEARTADDFHHIAGLGLVRACVGQPDGTSNLVLLGLTRVQLTRFVQEKPFRIAEYQELKSESSDTIETEALSNKVLQLCTELREDGLNIPASIDEQLAKVSDPEMIADIVSHTFVRDAQRRQELLTRLRISDRLRSLIRHLNEERLVG